MSTVQVGELSIHATEVAEVQVGSVAIIADPIPTTVQVSSLNIVSSSTAMVQVSSVLIVGAPPETTVEVSAVSITAGTASGTTGTAFYGLDGVLYPADVYIASGGVLHPIEIN